MSLTDSKRSDVTDLSQLQAVAERMATQAQAGDVIYLLGNLGAGKTTFTQYFLAACGIKDHVKSPTYTLYETYQSTDKHYIHMDLYRLTDPEELYFLGIEDLINGLNILLIEWPEKGLGVLPKANWTIELSTNGPNRSLTLTSSK